MYQENPCSMLRQAHRQFAALGAAEFALRRMFSEDEDTLDSQDNAICAQLHELEQLQFRVAQDLLTAKRRHDAWLKRQRDEAAQQVAEFD